jgi:hypothetical protein
MGCVIKRQLEAIGEGQRFSLGVNLCLQVRDDIEQRRIRPPAPQVRVDAVVTDGNRQAVGGLKPP